MFYLLKMLPFTLRNIIVTEPGEVEVSPQCHPWPRMFAMDGAPSGGGNGRLLRVLPQ